MVPRGDNNFMHNSRSSRKRVAASEDVATTSATKKSKPDSEDEKKLKVKEIV